MSDDKPTVQDLADWGRVLAKITGLLAGAGISIDAVLQREADEVGGEGRIVESQAGDGIDPGRAVAGWQVRGAVVARFGLR